MQIEPRLVVDGMCEVKELLQSWTVEEFYDFSQVRLLYSWTKTNARSP